MVLFRCWEWSNGARPEAQNRLSARMAASTDAASLREIARHDGLLRPSYRRDWEVGDRSGGGQTLLLLVGRVSREKDVG